MSDKQLCGENSSIYCNKPINHNQGGGEEVGVVCKSAEWPTEVANQRE